MEAIHWVPLFCFSAPYRDLWNRTVWAHWAVREWDTGLSRAMMPTCGGQSGRKLALLFHPAILPSSQLRGRHKTQSTPVLWEEAIWIYGQSTMLSASAYLWKAPVTVLHSPSESGAEIQHEREFPGGGGEHKTLDQVQYSSNKTLRSRHHYKIIDCGEQSHIPRWSIGHLTYQ